MDWRQADRYNSNRASDHSGRGQENGIYQGFTDAVNPEQQSMKVRYAGGEKSMTIPMPFESVNSWIRAVPESANPVLLCTRSDTHDVAFLRCLGDGSEKRIQLYQQNIGLYRPLQPGEIEIQSAGNAQSFYSSRPMLEHRGGAIRSWLDQDRAEAGTKAPTHVRALWEHQPQLILDEERFGAVKRPIMLNPANMAALALQTSNTSMTSYNIQEYPIPNFSVPTGAGGVPSPFGVAAQALAKASELLALTTGKFKIRPFAKEYLKVIKNPLANVLPTQPKLIDFREGHVFADGANVLVSGESNTDQNGQVLGSNGAYLRARYKYFTPSGDATVCEIDELGNVNWTTSLLGTVGWTTTIPTGLWTLKAFQDISMTSGMNISMTALQNISHTSFKFDSTAATDHEFTSTMNFAISAGGTYDMKAAQGITESSPMNIELKAGINNNFTAGTMTKITSPQVQIGPTPTTPAVMGTEFGQWLTELLTAFVTASPMLTTGNLGYPTPMDPTLLASINKAISTIPTWMSKTVMVSP